MYSPVFMDCIAITLLTNNGQRVMLARGMTKYLKIVVIYELAASVVYCVIESSVMYMYIQYACPF